MVRLSSALCIVFLTYTLQQTCTANPFLAAKEVLDFAIDLYQKIDNAQKYIEGMYFDPKYPRENLEEKENVEMEIYKQLDSLSTDFQDLKNTIMDKITNQLRDKLSHKTDELFKYIKDVQHMYTDFLDFYANSDKHQPAELRAFANTSTSFSMQETRAKIKSVHEALVDQDLKKESVISIIAKDSSAADTICIRGQSSQQLIYELYQTVALTDAKGLMMILYSYGIKEIFENLSYEYRKRKELNNYYLRINRTFNIVREAMANTSREVWKCDPSKHEKDVTYTKLQEVFQGFFMREPDTTRSTWEALGWNGCASLTDDRLRCRSAPCKAQPEERRCTGHLRDCQNVARWLQVCHSPPGSDRRYDWMKTGNGVVYGRDGKCERTQGLYEYFPYSIEVCLCNCESEQRDADRYFSLLDVTSDVKENKVVTGVKLVKKNHVFYIQIKQGKITVNGTISETPVWKDINEVPAEQLLSDTVSTHHYVVKSYPYENDARELIYDDWTEFHKNKLVYAVTYNRRTVYLDDLEARSNEVLTGLRFQQVDDELRLEIQTTPFDYKTGQLKQDASSWIAQTNTTKDRRELILSDPDNPTQILKSDTYSNNNEFVRFRMTDLRRDLGQYTVPFLDIQEVSTNPPMPMSGAGLFHKGKLHSGGFLSLKLFHYDFTRHM